MPPKKSRGHLWQGRFFSCVLDDDHWATALRYVEINPVRARMAKTAEDYGWSSARAHLGLAPPPAWLDPLTSKGTGQFQRHWPTPAHWQPSLATLTRREAAALRQATRADTALGSDEFISQLEQRYGIQLRPQPLGRPRKPPATGQLRSTITLAAGKGRSLLKMGRFFADTKGNQGDLLTTLLACAGIPIDCPVGIATKQIEELKT